jgi:hypothetical protein
MDICRVVRYIPASFKNRLKGPFYERSRLPLVWR